MLTLAQSEPAQFPDWEWLNISGDDVVAAGYVVTFQCSGMGHDPRLANHTQMTSHGVTIYAWAGKSVNNIMHYCEGYISPNKSIEVAFWRKAKKRIYRPSIYAEPLPLP